MNTTARLHSNVVDNASFETIISTQLNDGQWSIGNRATVGTRDDIILASKPKIGEKKNWRCEEERR